MEDIGFSYILVDDSNTIIEFNQTSSKARSVPNQELAYCNRILRKVIKENTDMISEVYFLVSCLKNRDIPYLKENKIGNKTNTENLSKILSGNPSIVMQTSFSSGSVDQFICQVCENIAYMASQGFHENSIIGEIIDESSKMLANVKSFTAEYKRRKYLRSIINLSGKAKNDRSIKKSVYCVMKSGPCGTKVVYATRSRDIAYEEVVRTNMLLMNHSRIVSRIMRDMPKISFNPDSITPEIASEWGAGKSLRYTLLKATDNGKYNNYYVEIVDYV